MELLDIAKLARLSRIDMSETEQKELLADMHSILGYVAQLESVTTTQTENALPLLRNVMRADKNAYAGGEYTEVLSKSAPESAAGYIKVAQVIADDIPLSV
ncbi:MAG: Asp-tRNA(Asn)/Glu-tRNA(Gln) amidotransferase subunit GatC [Candidatus Pacebacteria bacterium]|nr:Asp-tRNA(Asn)/Glu-tRNA(Gln) amidotransferase subunit GatC [Candidatus Paceibacterota bacterium]